AGNGAIGRQVLVTRKSEAEAAIRRGFLAFPPPETLRGLLDDVAPARIVEMSQSEFDRVGAREAGEFVHKTLDRKYIVVGAERPHRGNPYRHGRNEVMHHMRIGEFVD